MRDGSVTLARVLTRRPAVFGLLLILLVHLGIRLYLINQQGFFFEESMTWSYTESLDALLLAMVSDIHPPLYFVLMWVWVKLCGTSEIAFRLPSVLSSFLTLIGLVAFARTLDQGRHFSLAIWMGLLYVCLPYDILLSQTARSWTLLVFLCALYTYLYVGITLQDKSNWFIWSVIVAICAFYVHYITIVSVVATVGAGTLSRPTRENLLYGWKTAAILLVFLLPWLITVLPVQLVFKSVIPWHFWFLWEANGLGGLLAPINPGSWNIFSPIEESACLLYCAGLLIALVGVVLILLPAANCWTNTYTRYLMIQVGIMMLLLATSPVPLCNQRSMSIFLPPFLLLFSFALKNLWTSGQWRFRLIAGLFLAAFLATCLCGFPYRGENGSLREIAEFLAPNWNKARRPVALLSPSTHLLTCQYLQSRKMPTFSPTIVAPHPVILLDSPWYKSLQPEILVLPPKDCPRWNTGPHHQDGFVWTITQYFAQNQEVTDIFYLRQGSGDLFGKASPGPVPLGQYNYQSQVAVTRMQRFGKWSVYHIRPGDKIKFGGSLPTTQCGEAQLLSVAQSPFR